jgi:hypothetical protein
VAALVLVNEGKEEIDTIVLHLNPALAVESVEREGEPLPYRRDRQVLLVHAPAAAGDSTAITVRYAGGIDERVARLDVSERDRRASEGPFFNLGKRLAFLQEDFALLIPDALWYPTPPVAEPPVNARFRLEVKAPAGLVAVSQGERREGRDGSVSFEPDRPVSGVSLVAEKFARASATMPEGYAIDAYYLENNYLVRKYLAGMTGENAREYVSRLFFFSADTIEYPFKQLAIVEVPASFARFHRHDENRDDCIQPGLVLWLEEGFNSIWGKFTNPPATEDMSQPQLLPWTNIWLSQGHDHPGSYHLQSLFTGHGYTIRSREFPALDRAWRTTMFQARTSPANQTRFDDAVFHLLRSRSLGEVFRDSSLHPATRAVFTRVKGEMLFRRLFLNATRADLYRLHRQLERRFPARPVELDTLAAALREITGEDPLPFIREWHDEVGALPEFVIRDARKETFFVDGERWQRARFKVHNRGKAAGIISVTFNITERYSESFAIAPGEYKEVHVSKPGGIYRLEVHFGLSANIPSNAYYSLEEEGPAPGDASLKGERDIDPAEFPASPPAGVIIVDNVDEGFRVIESLPWIQRFRPRGKGVASRYPDRLTPRYHHWTESRDEAAYGDAVKSLHRREAGTGKSRVEWTTTLEEGGTYDLHAFASYYQLPGSSSEQLKATFYYSVSTPGEETLEVPARLCEFSGQWVHLGRFRVAPGACCTVALDDRVTYPATPIPANAPERRRDYVPALYVYADAIRWTRVDNP